MESNAYQVKLLDGVRTSDVFNIRHLIPYYEAEHEGTPIQGRISPRKQYDFLLDQLGQTPVRKEKWKSSATCLVPFHFSFYNFFAMFQFYPHCLIGFI